jgi:hypothetical protein
MVQVVSSYTLPPATTSTLGGVIVGDRLSVANDGTINVPLATVTDVGGVIVGSGLAITGAGVLSVTDPGYILPIASDTDLGGIKVGGNLAIANDGTLSLASDENIELGDGYIRTERSAAADAAYEARVGTSVSTSKFLLVVELRLVARLMRQAHSQMPIFSLIVMAMLLLLEISQQKMLN